MFALPPSRLKRSTRLSPAVKADSMRVFIMRPYVPLLLAPIPHEAPSAWISADRLAVLPAEKEKKKMETAATGRAHEPSTSRPGPGQVVLLDARELERGCLKEVGRRAPIIVRWFFSFGQWRLMCADIMIM
jgi:hypothetical protein